MPNEVRRVYATAHPAIFPTPHIVRGFSITLGVMPLSLDTPIADAHLRSLNRKVIKRLEEGLGIHTVRDLLFHLPARYEELGNVSPIKHLVPKMPVRILAVITSLKQGYTRRGALTNARVEDPTGKIDVTWFNQPWIAERLNVGDKILLTGKLTEGKSKKYLANPDYEIVQRAHSDAEPLAPIEQPRDIEAWDIEPERNVIPIYPETEGITSRWINFLVRDALTKVPQPKSALENIPLAKKMMPLVDALRIVHTPDTIEEAQRAQERILLEELLPIQCAVLRARFRLAKKEARAISLDAELIKEFLATLPFSLTESQRRAAFEILSDMERERPMHRLLVGDVGSGKTIVAAIAALNAARAGVQVALMAPTEILAQQHFKGLGAILKPFKVRVALLTGSTSRVTPKNLSEASIKISKVKLHKDVSSGEIDLVIGTHALIVIPTSKRQSTLKPKGQLAFAQLGLAIVDEQHRFGVNQRAHVAKLQRGLTSARGGAEQPHFLTMTATPIPRTLALTIFGDLDLSTMTELPKGRKPITTKIISPRSRKKAHELILREVAAGHQAFVICPLVKESEKIQAKSAEEEYKKLSEGVMSDLRLGLLHGQMKAPEKNAVMTDFAKGKIDVLVATSVVEVGIDVPNATVIAIEGSERFGLAQLYQMRGRVGRGEHKSYCLLMVDKASATTRKRLKAMVDAKSGADIANADLDIRGPGELVGTRQSGIPDVAMRALANLTMIEKTRTLAKALLKDDPALKKHPALAKRTRSLEAALHIS